MIEARGITKRYGHHTVLDNVSVQIPRGGITALIGPNGAGKSTLLSIISRLMKPDGGTVSIDGSDINRIHSEQLARRMAVLSQSNNLAVRLTVEDLVSFGRYPNRLVGALAQHCHAAGQLLAVDAVDEPEQQPGGSAHGRGSRQFWPLPVLEGPAGSRRPPAH